MIYTINDEFETLNQLPRLLQEDIAPNYKAVRVYRKSDIDYIQLEDYLQVQDNPDALYQIIMENDLELDNIEFVVDETHIIDNPHMINSNKHIINGNKVVVKKMNTDNYARAVKEAIEEYESTGIWNKFDLLIEADSIGGAAVEGLKKGTKEGLKTTAKTIGKNVRNAALLAGGVGAVAYGINKFANKMADKDARITIHSGRRSELIKKLRVLNGKYEEYESKYDKADYQRKNILGKILYKIKMAIKRLKGQIA